MKKGYDDYGGENMSRGLLIFICLFLVIAFSVAYAELYHRWQDEKWARMSAEILAESRLHDSEHYFDLYYKCVNGR